MSKKCTKCGETKELGEFPKQKNRKGAVVYRAACKQCKKNYLKSYYSKNRDKQLSDMKARRDDPVKGAEIKARKKAYAATERGKELQAKRAASHYDSNKEAIKNRAKEWEAAKGSEYSRIRHAKWRNENREAARMHVKTRRTLLSLGRSASIEQIKSRLDYYGNKCVYCGSTEKIEIEHRIPLSRGGTNFPANLVPACKTCNCKKGTKTETEYKNHLTSLENAV